MADDEMPKQPLSSQPEQNVSSEVQKTTSSTEPPTSASSSTQSHESQSSSPPATTESAVVSTTPAESREELIARARSFLTSPQIQHEDIFAKRRFLSDKGLNDTEINGLLQELPIQAPHIPPRTYPAPPPSNLPNLLIGLARIITWVTGGSAVAFFIYYRYLLPLLTQSYQARLSLKSHQKDLLTRLTTSIESLKETQTESFSVLPKPEAFKEDPKFKHCHTLDQAVGASNEKPQAIPPFSVLRCALEELVTQDKEADTESLFRNIEAKLPWIISDPENGALYQNALWQTLSSNPLFSHTDTSTTSIWSYNAPIPASPTPLLASLSTLRSTLPPARSQINPFQHTLQALSDFTGYITTKIYALPTVSSYRAPGLNIGATLGPEEEDLRKEIRALKGLVLNRRSFMPTVPRPSSTPPAPKPATTP